MTAGVGQGGKPRLLDLFCCAGGAAKGYHQAGFEVVGVDIRPQPRYPFEFIEADCLSLDPAFIATFDAVHASPPCQGYTDLRHAPGAKGAPRLIRRVRELLREAGPLFVIENVEGAADEMIEPVTLCGSMFPTLEAHHLGETIGFLRRHRLFETSFPLRKINCRHDISAPVIGVYGGHARVRAAGWGGRKTKDDWSAFGGHKAIAQQVMGIDWMTLAEMSEAIPPAYTKFIGQQLLAHLALREAA